jgi:hypothetical protein
MNSFDAAIFIGLIVAVITGFKGFAYQLCRGHRGPFLICIPGVR